MGEKPFVYPGRNPYRNDPDETEGRALYRGKANAEGILYFPYPTLAEAANG